MSNDKAHVANTAATADNGVQCQIDQVWVHSVPAYLQRVHPEVSVEAYQERYGASTPLFSKTLLDRKAAKTDTPEPLILSAATSAGAAVVRLHPDRAPGNDWSFAPPTRASFSDVFELGGVKAAQNNRGEPIMIEVLGEAGDDARGFIPAVDPNYIFNIDLLKAVMMAYALKMPFLAWGMHGTGKTTILEQFCARTKRPMIRVQHTASTEEAHVLGQYVLKNGATEFEPGPLAIAMKYGLAYLADEYDFALPNVTAVYQPVLEGKALVIKEAPPEWRVIQPHPNFRFAATGNTNGGGDETGLYQGTQIQNAANYSRFGITVEVEYMSEKQEIAVVAAQGGIHVDDAEKFIKVARAVRDSYRRGEIGVTVSPRELINAAKLGRALGGKWRDGLNLAYLNRLGTVDKKAVGDMAQRILA